MVSTAQGGTRPPSTEFVITRRGSLLFDDISVGSGPAMNWQGREKHGNFVVKSAPVFRDLLDERMVISGSDGSSRSIIVTAIVDNIVYFRAGGDVTS